MVEIAHYRIVFEKMGQCFCVRKVIYCHQIDVLIAKPRPHDRASYASKTVYTYFYSHCDLISSKKVRILNP
jgi:hypothetical protein